jgi:two-component system chemotaxis response regulator CheB
VTDAPKLRVLVADDSAFARRVFRQALEKHPNIEVVGIAGDGLETLEKIAVLKPDVITLDLMMPELDGLGVLRELGDLAAAPKVVIVSISDQDSELVVQALQLGAVDIVKKPTALATDRLYELSEELTAKVFAAGRARPLPSVPASAPRSSSFSARPNASKLVAIGTSTGGPQALTRLLAGLPPDFPLPVAIALHIPAEYTDALARRLDQGCALEVLEASDGLELRRGRVVLAKGGMDLLVDRSGDQTFARLAQPRPDALFTPSVDRLFEAAASAWGANLLAVVLTGMGDDGLRGARAVVAAGGKVLTEAESSCVVYGMPRSVYEAGLSANQARIENMVAAIQNRL